MTSGQTGSDTLLARIGAKKRSKSTGEWGHFGSKWVIIRCQTTRFLWFGVRCFHGSKKWVRLFVRLLDGSWGGCSLLGRQRPSPSVRRSPTIRTRSRSAVAGRSTRARHIDQHNSTSSWGVGESWAIGEGFSEDSGRCHRRPRHDRLPGTDRRPCPPPRAGQRGGRDHRHGRKGCSGWGLHLGGLHAEHPSRTRQPGSGRVRCPPGAAGEIRQRLPGRGRQQGGARGTNWRPNLGCFVAGGAVAFTDDGAPVSSASLMQPGVTILQDVRSLHHAALSGVRADGRRRHE